MNHNFRKPHRLTLISLKDHPQSQRAAIVATFVEAEGALLRNILRSLPLRLGKLSHAL